MPATPSAHCKRFKIETNGIDDVLQIFEIKET
jgi:hypothetical protein